MSDMQSPDPALLELLHLLSERGYRFTTVTPATHARVVGREGRQWATSVEDVFGWSLPFSADTVGPSLFGAMLAASVLKPCDGGWRSTVRVSSLQGRLFLHSAWPTLDADSVFFGPDTYRYADAIVRFLGHGTSKVGRAVDIGCGAGPGAIVIAGYCPEAEVIAVDINDAALRLTTVNAAAARMRRVVAVNSNLLDAVDGAFDLIVANPPYLLDPEERLYRHGGGGLGEGLSVSIARLAGQRLAPGGHLLLYTGSAIVRGQDRFKELVTGALEGAGLEWRYEELDPDVFGEELAEPAYADADRIAAVLVTARKP